MNLKPKRTALLAYAATLLLTVAALIVVLRLWKADLAIPLEYEADALESGLLVKGVVDSGWYLSNGFIAMPEGLDMRGFPFSANIHFLTIKLLAFFVSGWASVMNAFFLLTFPLTALCALFVFRRFKLSYAPSIAGSLLYAFLPYHFFRGEQHLFLAAYYVVPLMVMVVLWVGSGEISLARRGNFKELFSDKKLVAGVVICLLTASSDFYYAFFACLFLLVAGVKGSLAKSSRGPILMSAFFAFTITAAVLAGLSPTFRYQRLNRGALAVRPRSASESENTGLKIAQLLLPANGENIHVLARLRKDYDRTAPLVNENRSALLGLAGGLGFVLLIAAAVFREIRLGSDLLEDLSVLNIAGVLYAAIGGFGSLFAYFVFPDFRSLNRISIFIGFFSLFAVVIVLDKILKRFSTSRLSERIGWVAVAAFAVLGIWDQTGHGFDYPADSVKAEYLNDSRFVAAIEASVPERAMIFQLPVMPFPESLRGYEHLKGYLHSNKLRWSYGAMGEAEAWQRQVESKPPADFVAAIASAGFKGVSVDRSGYADEGAALERKLAFLLKIRPIVSDDKRRSFFGFSGSQP